jgi:hypothetical protein
LFAYLQGRIIRELRRVQTIISQFDCWLCILWLGNC